jgi:heme exporter protein D
MDSVVEYLQMGGYAMFVWPAYGLAALGLVGVLWMSVTEWRDREQEFSGLKARGDDEGGP